MFKADIKIVGLISDEEEFDEIQSIAKIFVYEQRMKGFEYPMKAKDSIRKNYLKHFKINGYRKVPSNNIPFLRVRGFA